MTRRWIIAVLAIVLGTALLVWQVRDTGIDHITRGLTAVGWMGAAGILLLSFFRFVARSTGWSALIAGDTAPGRALAAMLVGEALGSLTPLSLVVSEPAKAAYLASRRGGVTTAAALAALAAETFIVGVSVAIYIICGAATLLYVYPVDDALRAAGLWSLAGMAAALAGAAWMAWHKPALVSALVRRVPLGSAAAFADRMHSFERSAYASTMHDGARVGLVVACAAFFHLLSYVELWLTLWLITGESLPAAAFILDTVGRLTNVLFKMIPLQLGVLQVGSELVARAMGLAPGAGVTVALIRTVRVLFWSAIGVALLARRSVKEG